MKDSDLNFYPGEGYYTGKLTYTLLDDRRRRRRGCRARRGWGR